jgi:N-ethylmaleimide reductase
MPEWRLHEAATVERTPRAVEAPDTAPLFQPYRLGPFNLRHRIVMAPLTRSRARRPAR